MSLVADGIHLVSHAHVNCYVIEGEGGVTIVDAGLPGSWGPLTSVLRDAGYRPRDIRAVVLTHAHFDHVGCAKALQERIDAPMYIHPGDMDLAAHPYSYAHEQPRAIYPITHPRAIPILLAMTGAGALKVTGVTGLREMRPGRELDVPGRPMVIATPGHTYGHCALHLRDRSVVLTGDALVTLDPYTGRTGPRIVAGAATADSDLNFASLRPLAATGANIVLPGHGDPFTDGIENAVDLARSAGAA